MSGQMGSCTKKQENSKKIDNSKTFNEKNKCKKMCVNLQLPI